MEYINAIIGETEMFVPTNDKLGELLFTANRRVNYHKYIAKMRKAYQGKIESRASLTNRSIKKQYCNLQYCFFAPFCRI